MKMLIATMLTTLLFWNGATKSATDALTAAAASEDFPAEKNGWWIRVNTSRTEASQISFEIGTDDDNRRFWKTWNSGDANEFDVPAEFRNVANLYIHASSNPSDQNAWFCMMYRQNGVKHFDFDDDEDHRESQSDHDDECN